MVPSCAALIAPRMDPWPPLARASPSFMILPVAVILGPQTQPGRILWASCSKRV